MTNDFQTTGPTRLYEQENLAPMVPAPVASAPQFKAPAPPAPRPASTSSSETNTAVPTDEDIGQSHDYANRYLCLQKIYN